ncbi:sigma-70 family RNA polymerase sigma factor [Mycolicibacterium sphagni]|uniref:RNA polymerase sigma factor n=1 Tax=Mycolicibacterium sphagni TaxID=1786 RepID=A0ABX2KB07_9MYCO|nr:RNA polymerase sigma factor [Mycolicibacterium sphagni]
MVAGRVDESALIVALRAGDQIAFAALVDEHTPTMLRVARGYVADHATVEEVVQETWIALFKGISKFEARSSLRTWLFAVMINIAKARGIRERRDRDAATSFMGATVDPARFHAGGDVHAGSWREPPTPFPDSPEGSVLGKELRSIAERELDRLPERQRTVVTLRDMLGFDSAEVCELLGITAGNQRILLHRGRAAIRQVLEDYVREDSSAPSDP